MTSVVQFINKSHLWASSFFYEANSFSLGDLRTNASPILVNQICVTGQVQFDSWTDDSYE